ncbi:magnesium transporter CorA family protein [Caldimonas tepidiphila]|uniref:magnesium transporter CorA family protein n=1 Tax=Caldimonas tepidiphila TaxID=2315841 RepID=UPI000E5B0D11|nr:magnesium transporter CorA family protein [Caldimonas tepidiphila]
MRVFHVQGHCAELGALPERLPEQGYLWIASERPDFEAGVPALQDALQRWTPGPLAELHVSDLLNPQLPSHYDDTSWYALLVFRRLAAGNGNGNGNGAATEALPAASGASGRMLESIDTSPIGFAVFDRVLLTVHPVGCPVREFFIARFLKALPPEGSEARPASLRLPGSPAEQMLRMTNHIVDGYLELRRVLTRQFGPMQQALLGPRSRFDDWQALLAARNTLHQLEDICEDQRSAIQEWIDALDELPHESDPAKARERDLMRVRARDVLEHIERVLGHVRRLENSAETAVQMHFSAQSHRTNAIMRTLTVLTAIFLPLNLITGIFGMNFEALPLIHSARGFWIAFAVMVAVGAGLGWFFWRKRYIGTHH